MRESFKKLQQSVCTCYLVHDNQKLEQCLYALQCFTALHLPGKKIQNVTKCYFSKGHQKHLPTGIMSAGSFKKNRQYMGTFGNGLD